MRAEKRGREQILARIRRATATAEPVSQPPRSASTTRSVENLLERFCAECEQNNTECQRLPDWAAGSRSLDNLLSEIPRGEIFVQDAPMLRRWTAQLPAGYAIQWSSQGRISESARAAVTLARVLVAETGSIMVSTDCGGRAASVAAPVHIVLAEKAQIVSDLRAALSTIQRNGERFASSSFSLITGSSRTADIEKILVLGAHGPRRLIVLLLEQSE